MSTSLAIVNRELEARLDIFRQVLPPGITPQRLARTVAMSIERLPKLLECDINSIMSAATTAAVLGLEVDGVTGQAFILPFKGRAQLIIGAKGFNTLAARAGYTLNSDVVREGDEFDYSLGTGGFVKHKPLLTDVQRRRIVAAWAVAESNGRPAIVVVMSMEEIMQIKERAPGGRKSDSPWQDFNGPGFPAMCAKTAKRRLARSMPLSVMQTASAYDAQVEMGNHAHLEPDGNLKVVGEQSAEGPVAREEIITVQPEDILSPANPTGDWKVFKGLGEWADWSADVYLPEADQAGAKAWHAHYQKQFMALSSKQEERPWDGYYNDLMKAYGAAMLR